MKESLKTLAAVKKEKSPLPRRPEAKSASSPALAPISPSEGGRDRRGTFHADSSFDRENDEEDDYDDDDLEPDRMKSSH